MRLIKTRRLLWADRRANATGLLLCDVTSVRRVLVLPPLFALELLMLLPLLEVFLIIDPVVVVTILVLVRSLIAWFYILSGPTETR